MKVCFYLIFVSSIISLLLPNFFDFFVLSSFTMFLYSFKGVHRFLTRFLFTIFFKHICIISTWVEGHLDVVVWSFVVGSWYIVTHWRHFVERGERRLTPDHKLKPSILQDRLDRLRAKVVVYTSLQEGCRSIRLKWITCHVDDLTAAKKATKSEVLTDGFEPSNEHFFLILHAYVGCEGVNERSTRLTNRFEHVRSLFLQSRFQVRVLVMLIFWLC